MREGRGDGKEKGWIAEGGTSRRARAEKGKGKKRETTNYQACLCAVHWTYSNTIKRLLNLPRGPFSFHNYIENVKQAHASHRTENIKHPTSCCPIKKKKLTDFFPLVLITMILISCLHHESEDQTTVTI